MNAPLLTPRQLEKLDGRPVFDRPGAVLAFVGVHNEMVRLPFFLDYYRKLGVDWFFVMDNCSSDGTREFVLEQPDCHCFHTEGSHFALNVDPPRWTNALLNVFGDDRWCLSMDADELFVYPHCESVPLDRLCEYLGGIGRQAVTAAMVDMYSDGPLRNPSYRQGENFLAGAPYFDSRPAGFRANFGGFPPRQMFGGVRERAFWKGPIAHTRPPCLTKVPLVKWRKGMAYRVAQHTISEVGLAEISGALLHFKFLSGFEEKTEKSVTENAGVPEKGLQEREAYLAALRRDPDMSLMYELSVRYENSGQLVRLGWMESTPDYERFLGL
jgi:hypothetical protein